MSAASNAKKISKGQEKAKALRDSCWPDLDDEKLWNRKLVKGFTTIPRTMPLIMNIIDSLTKNKPAGMVFFVLWCRTFDESLLAIDTLLDGLGARTRQIFLMVQLEGLSYVQVGRQLGLSVTTVKNHLGKALLQCILLMED